MQVTTRRGTLPIQQDRRVAERRAASPTRSETRTAAGTKTPAARSLEARLKDAARQAFTHFGED